VGAVQRIATIHRPCAHQSIRIYLQSAHTVAQHKRSHKKSSQLCSWEDVIKLQNQEV